MSISTAAKAENPKDKITELRKYHESTFEA